MVIINDPTDSVAFLHQAFVIGQGKKWHLYKRCPMENLPRRRFGEERHFYIIDCWVGKDSICCACFNEYVRSGGVRV